MMSSSVTAWIFAVLFGALLSAACSDERPDVLVDAGEGDQDQGVDADSEALDGGRDADGFLDVDDVEDTDSVELRDATADAESDTDSGDEPVYLRVTVILFTSSVPVGYDHRSAVDFAVDAAVPSTNGLIGIDVDSEVELSAPPEGPGHDYDSVLVDYPWLLPEDVPRIWYYHIGFDLLLADLREAIESAGVDMSSTDLLWVITDLQFEGLGVFLGQDTLGQWAIMVPALELGGWAFDEPARFVATEYTLTEETLHELGHFMGLNHACNSCNDVPVNEARVCCDNCTAKDDIMSYCRQRPLEEEDDFHNTFLACSLDLIEHQFIPAFLAAEDIPYNASCE